MCMYVYVYIFSYVNGAKCAAAAVAKNKLKDAKISDGVENQGEL